MPIDYSKWNNLEEYSDDDEDNGEQQEEENAPRVTRLDGPSQVTFGGASSGEGEPITIQPSDSTNMVSPNTALNQKTPFPTTAISEESSPTATTANPNPDTADASTASNKYDSWQAKGGMVSVDSSGNHPRRLYWSQDRYSVVLRIELFGEEKAKKVGVDGAVSYLDRFCAVGTLKPTIRVFSTSSKSTTSDVPLQLLLEGELPHAVHYAEDDEDDEIEWGVERSWKEEERFLAITLYKAVPFQGVSIWWRRPLMGFEEIKDIGDSNASSQAFGQAWEEAHKIFLERRQQGKTTI